MLREDTDPARQPFDLEQLKAIRRAADGANAGVPVEVRQKFTVFRSKTTDPTSATPYRTG